MSATATLPALLTPQSTPRDFVAALNGGDLEAATRCFAKDGCMLTPDATAIRGREEIRPILAQLIARGTRIEALTSSLLVAGEVALGSERWVIRSAGPEGRVLAQETTPALVLRELQGAWKLAVAAPWGWGAL